MNSLQKLRGLVSKISYVSKLTSVKNKKLRILFSIVLSNLSVVFDVYIIVVFSFLIIKDTQYKNQYILDLIDFSSNNNFLLPTIIILRFSFLFIERTNLEILNLDVARNLRFHLMEESFKKGNMSNNDIYYYLNTVSTHVSSFYKTFAHFFNYLIQVVAYSIFLLFTNANIFYVFLVGGLIIALPSRIFLKKGKYYQHLSFSDGKIINSIIQRIIDNIFLIKVLDTSKIEFKRYYEYLENFRNSQKFNNIYGAVNSLIPSFFTILLMSIVFLNFEISDLITLEFVAVLLRLFQTLGSLNQTLGLLLNSSVHVEELYKLDKSSPDIDLNNFQTNKENKFAISFNDVSFSYFNSNENILNNLNLNIPKNEHTIITGSNGSGKSTILGLISGVYIANKGKVEVFSDNVGYVGVTPLVFEGSIKENLVYGNINKITDTEMIDLLTEFKFFNENNIDLNLKVSNKSLSSGQLQKLSFIRSLLNNTEILLLDESTSNLDVGTKRFIFDILSNKNITIVNATHNMEDFNYDNQLKIEVDKNNNRVVNFK